MNKIYKKNELYFALIWIGLYVVLMSVGDSISEALGIAKLATALIAVILSVLIYLWISKNGLREKYGLCRLQGEGKRYLYFIPLILLASVNLWWGVRLELPYLETALYVLSMLCVGFLEEIIFRGFLFKAICKSNVKRAIIISSITFGLGHIVNLLNGRDIPETLLQICYAVAIGWLFTIIFHRGKTLLPCIVTHSVINSLSVFANNDTTQRLLVISVFLCVVSIGYTVYILKVTGKDAGTK